MRLGSGPSQVLQSSVCTHENGGLMLKKKVNVFAFYAMEREFKHSVERNRVYKGWGLENLRYIWNLERSLGVTGAHGREGTFILLRILVLTPRSPSPWARKPGTPLTPEGNQVGWEGCSIKGSPKHSGGRGSKIPWVSPCQALWGEGWRQFPHQCWDRGSWGEGYILLCVQILDPKLFTF